MHKIEYYSPYYFGDLVDCNAQHTGSFQGRVSEIVLSEDGSVYYGVLCNDGIIQYGIYPWQMMLVKNNC